MSTEKSGIPLYTKIGIRVTVVLMLVFGFLLIRNCSSSVYYGAATPEIAIDDAYDLGVEHGRAQALSDQPAVPSFGEANPMLQKAYQKGFRAGWDAARNNRPNTLSPTSTAAPANPTTPATTAPSDSDGR